MDFVALDLNRRGEQTVPPSDPALVNEQLKTLIRGIAIHAVVGEADDFAQFSKELSEVADGFSSEAIEAVVSNVLRLTKGYNARAAIFFNSQAEELRGMLKTMIQTLEFLAASSSTSAKQLGLVETQLERAKGLEDLWQLRTSLSSCLAVVRRETVRIETETKIRIQVLTEQQERLSKRLKTVEAEESLDGVTGLPGRAAAEQLIATRLTSGKAFTLALFVIEQLNEINGRWGRDAGDDVVVTCAQMLARKLSGAALYRWSGPALLGIFDLSVAAAEAEKSARYASAEPVKSNRDASYIGAVPPAGVACHIRHIAPKALISEEIFSDLDKLINRT